MEDDGIGLVAAVVVVLVVLGAVGGVFIITRWVAEQPEAPGEGENLPPDGGQPPQSEGISVVFTGSSYQSVTQKPTGWFTTGQDADIVLGPTDFDKAEPTLFNHPMKVATDGTRLVLADTWNNRILIWNSIPNENNKRPDLVIGQDNLYSNTPGLARNKLNWPVGVATDGQRLVVADTLNNRILIWNEFPTQNGEDADLVLGAADFTTRNAALPGPGTGSREAIVWPWDVFIDGNRLLVANTGAVRVSIWNALPTQNNQPADVILTSTVGLQTPRSARSDGQHLIVGDYNANKTFVWNQIPTSDDTPYSFILSVNPNSPQALAWSANMVGGKLIAAVDWYIEIWNQFPTDANDSSDLVITSTNSSHSGATATSNYFIVSEFNKNRVSIFNGIPTSSGAMPNVVLGADNYNSNTLLDNYNTIQNASVYSDGSRLFIGSDFDRRLSVWKNLPNQSVAVPDIVYEGLGGGGLTIYNNKLVAVDAGGKVYIWNQLPLNGENYDIEIGPQLGSSMQLSQPWGVAADANYMFVGDKGQNKIFVWQGGIPTTARAPDFTIDVYTPYQLHSDGQRLFVASIERGIYIWNLPLNTSNLDYDVFIDKLFIGMNLPQGVFSDGTHLFVADTSNNRVLIWNTIPTTGTVQPDVVLGQQDFNDTCPRTTKSGLYMPRSLYFDGRFLWVGEFKFSNRVLRYSVH